MYLDPLGVEIRTRSSAAAQPLAPAPVTIGNNVNNPLPGSNRDDFLFVPSIGDVPSIELPDFLPDLLGLPTVIIYHSLIIH